MFAQYDHRYPSVDDLRVRARRRMPKFAFDYLDGAIDGEICKKRNSQDLQEVNLIPGYFKSVEHTDLSVKLFGDQYQMGFGVPPVGLANMLWPGAEKTLAVSAQSAGIPYILSTYGTTEMELIADLAPDVSWFQLYVPQEQAAMKDLIQRAKDSGFKALVITLDIPVGAKRNRELKNGLKLPFRFTPQIAWQIMSKPVWAFETLIHGAPDFVNIKRYGKDSNMDLGEFITRFAMHGISLERLKEIRKLWNGPLVLKGIQSPADFYKARDLGADGIIVSNHGGRQLDAAPSSVESLKTVPDDIHESMTVMFDSGVRTGLDVVRAKALGAQACFSGRSFFYGMGAMGKRGANQVIGIFQDEISRTLKQIGCDSFSELDASWLE